MQKLQTTKSGRFLLPVFINLSIICFVSVTAKAQCPAGTFNNTGFFPAFVTPSQPGIANENTAHAAWGGDYYLFNVTAGNTYIFRSCFPENSAINTVLSLYNSAGTTLLAFNDDFCGQQSQVSWLATFTGQVRLSYYQSGCTTVFIDTKLGVYYTTPCTAPSVVTHPANITTCNSYTTSFSIAATGTASLTYQWQVNTGAGFSNIINGGVYTNATTATLNITGATTAMNSYQYRCVVTNACGNATSNAAILTVNATNNWTGAVSNNWHIAGNWSCGAIPGPNDDVVISSGSLVIASGATAQCRNLSKSGFASSVNLSGSTLQVYGNLTYTGGSFITNATSSMQFTGTTQQQLLGATPLAVSNITINNPAGVVVSKAVTISGTLSFITGHLFTNNNTVTATAVSGASATAFVVTADAANVPSSAGGFSMPFNTGDTKTIPVGPNSGSYNPAVIRLVAGPAETFTLRMENGVPPGAPTNRSVQKIWNINEATTGGTEADITLQWNTSHEGVTFNRNACGVVKSNGTSIVYTGYSVQTGAATTVGANTYQKTTTGVTEFSPWGVTSDVVILPVVLKTFNLFSLPQKRAELKWELAAGSTPQLFSLYRSSDGINYSLWKEIGAIGNKEVYSVIDEQPLPATSYYRMKITGQDGEIRYSQVLRYQSESRNVFAAEVYPNPVTDFLQLQLRVPGNEQVQLQLLNSLGQPVIQKIFTLSKGTHTLTMDVSHIATGAYYLWLKSESGLQQAHAILKK